MCETHSAVIFLIGDRAYKLKKPVNLGFLDFSTKERRLAVCELEVSLNRRLAPDVYLGIADVTDVDRHVMDHLVVMKRMPAESRLAHLVRNRVEAHADVRELAHLMAAFHSRCDRSAEISRCGDRAALAKRWQSNLVALQRFVGSILEGDQVAEIERLVTRFLAGRSPLLDDRIRHGAVVDGHGDLLAEDIFFLPDGPRILDCIEFDQHLRYLDQIDDIACLAMDLERLGAGSLGQHFVDCYQEFSGDHAPTGLVHHYVAYRAVMRAKVACLRHEQGGNGAAEARKLLRLAHRHLADARPRMILVGGGPGTGKSTIAGAIADRLGFGILSSDRIRKELAGVDAETSQAAPYGEGLYSTEWTERTYAELVRRAELLLGMGESVVLDATWSARRWREDAAHVSERTSSDLHRLRCDVDDSTADARMASRIAVSDADPEIAAVLRASFEPWPEAVVIETQDAVDDCVDVAMGDVAPPIKNGPMSLPRMPAD